MGGGAWPFLVGGAICLVNSDNERDSSLLNRWRVLSLKFRVRSWSGPGSALRPGEFPASKALIPDPMMKLILFLFSS